MSPRTGTGRAPGTVDRQDLALEFAEFVLHGFEGKEPPTIIEVHPLFRSSVSGVEDFLNTYEVFEAAILAKYADRQIVIENRAGTNGKWIRLRNLTSRKDWHRSRLGIQGFAQVGWVDRN